MSGTEVTVKQEKVVEDEEGHEASHDDPRRRTNKRQGRRRRRSGPPPTANGKPGGAPPPRRESKSHTGAGVLPICLHDGQLHILVQHQIYLRPRNNSGGDKLKEEKDTTNEATDRPKLISKNARIEKKFSFIDFGKPIVPPLPARSNRRRRNTEGEEKAEENGDVSNDKPQTTIHLEAARAFLAELPPGAAELLLPKDSVSSAESLAEKLQKAPAMIFNEGYVMFVIYVAFVPTCLLSQQELLDRRAENEIPGTYFKKIQTMWWFPLAELRRVFLPLHARVSVEHLPKRLASLELSMKGHINAKKLQHSVLRNAIHRRPRRNKSSGAGDQNEKESEVEKGVSGAGDEPQRLSEEEIASRVEQMKAEILARSQTVNDMNQASLAKYTPLWRGKVTDIKNVCRRAVWETLMALSQTLEPRRRCFDRIPYFILCDLACKRLVQAKEFTNGDNRIFKVNGSLAQAFTRYLILCKGRTLLVPSPALETGFLYKLDPRKIKNTQQKEMASTKKGMVKLGEVLSGENIEDLRALGHIDVVVVGSVCVCPLTGARLGKGSGWAELEWAILSELGLVDDKTLLATTVHDMQVIYGFPGEELTESHDLVMDLIATPTRVIRPTNKLERKPAFIQWDLISDEKLAAVPILCEMKALKK